MNKNQKDLLIIIVSNAFKIMQIKKLEYELKKKED